LFSSLRRGKPGLYEFRNYFEGGADGGTLAPLGEAAGGQGVPEGVVPGVPGVAELPWSFPEVDGDEPGLVDPVFGVEPPGVPGVPGRVPQGELLGVVVFGSTVDVEPGTVVGGGVVGVEGLPGGVVVVAGGVAVLPGGVAVLGVWVCPAVPGVPVDGVPPEGALCATTQIAQKSSRERKLSFRADIGRASALNFC
jgi:hypothetical protein